MTAVNTDQMAPFLQRLLASPNDATVIRLLQALKIGSTTDALTEGVSNLFFTNERVDDRVANLLVAGANITLTYVDAANTLTIAATGGGGAVSLVSTVTVSGAAVTTVSFTGLDLATDGRYLLDIEFVNATATGGYILLYFNADTTAANYRTQARYLQNGAQGIYNTSTAESTYLYPSYSSRAIYDIRMDPTTRPRTKMWSVEDNPTTMTSLDLTHVRNVSANVTSIALTAQVAGAIGIGSVAKLWKMN